MSTPPPRKICCFLFVQEVDGRGNGYSLLQMLFLDAVVSAWLGYSISQMLFLMQWYLHDWDIWYRRCFLDAAVSARVRYSLLRMLFSCQSCIIASAIYLFHDLQILTSTKLHLQPAYSITWRCFPLKNCIFNLLIPRLVDASAPKTTSSTCLFQDS